ncbi:Mucin-associated surface protein (MASP) [Trypanosoma cruzi]|uniref:Mucin-associated surface protein (MASP), putative n=2 Tax=Trypanosoma cruzi TaxID=5693 RepID=Q4DBI9_TRYCC|nr:mucin-associated surface protein (MASP), putative [Trypanosoma cruzi]EAN89881.1 mucin-associated surface protein (MASP), putative [Trypanosoma cruzi]KAF8303697.1 Mucin-associated surface protein (MASP), subgroup S025 [Trypanosoma cruzi]PWV09802.1 Mucin-associated surface protein (MASP) [Trypanosoma cruzi]RNC52745.1 mucin-associated surface protein (MASP) [Trypanosoma cruzi]|eukprot:XP_811732.1 mucin-associated surface protein (MASP) [Trypanosoma cruzi strain CL Brener]
MAMMMTGRVLLVCALCVLWCGAGGGECTEVVKAPADGAGSGSEPLVQSQELGTSPQGSQELKDGAPVVKKEAPPAPPTPSYEEDDDDEDNDGKGDGDGQEDESPSEHLEETVEDAAGKEKTKTQLQNKEQEVRQPPKSQVHVPQQPQSQTQLQPQPHTPASEEGEGVGENNAGGAGQPSLGVENKGNADSRALGKGDSLRGPGKESESSEPVQTTVPNTVPPEHKTKNEMLTPEQKTNESQSTDTSTNLPELQKENKEYPASTEGAVQSTSTGIQEQEAEPSTSEEPSRFEEEHSTGTKTTEDARTPDAAATEKRQTGDNEKVGDSDGSTAVSHTSSPLLLLLVACAAAVVAA